MTASIKASFCCQYLSPSQISLRIIFSLWGMKLYIRAKNVYYLIGSIVRKYQIIVVNGF